MKKEDVKWQVRDCQHGKVFSFNTFAGMVRFFYAMLRQHAKENEAEKKKS